MRIFHFPAFSFSGPCPFKFYTIFAREFYSCQYTVPNHGMGAPLLYPNRELTYTTCLTYSVARTLRTGGESRDALLQRRFRSAISRSFLRVGPDVTSGIRCEYNCEWISRLYLASDLRTTPPPNRDHCDPQRFRTFPPRRLRSL